MKRQELATYSILELTIQLLRDGRPRKLPGKPRPRAEFTNGVFGKEPCNPRNLWAERYSLDGAVTKAAYSYRTVISAATLSRARKEATEAILQALADLDEAHLTLADADNAIADTRLIKRAVKRACKSWRPINA